MESRQRSDLVIFGRRQDSDYRRYTINSEIHQIERDATVPLGNSTTGGVIALTGGRGARDDTKVVARTVNHHQIVSQRSAINLNRDFTHQYAGRIDREREHVDVRQGDAVSEGVSRHKVGEAHSLTPAVNGNVWQRRKVIDIGGDAERGIFRFDIRRGFGVVRQNLEGIVASDAEHAQVGNCDCVNLIAARLGHAAHLDTHRLFNGNLAEIDSVTLGAISISGMGNEVHTVNSPIRRGGISRQYGDWRIIAFGGDTTELDVAAIGHLKRAISVGDYCNGGSDFNITVMQEEVVGTAGDRHVFHAIGANHGRANDIRRIKGIEKRRAVKGD